MDSNTIRYEKKWCKDRGVNMKYFFIYSAGGGAGDWNGVKRVWSDSMPEAIKSNILLKFGDVYYNHAPGSSLVKPRIWNSVNNFRDWLYQPTQDSFVLNQSNILLDSGTSKIVSYITHNNPEYSPEEIITEFDRLLIENNIFDKYVSIIEDSNITYAVTFDIPNTFKIRSQNGDTRRIHFNAAQEHIMIDRCIDYCNTLYNRLGSQEKILTTFSATWSAEGIQHFIDSLDYQPTKLAIGGISDANIENTETYLNRVQSVIDLYSFEFVHFLGCGGFKKVRKLKELGYSDNSRFSVDNSTPMNRAIDGNTSGTSQSGYIRYDNGKLIRIKPDTVEEVIRVNSQSENPLFGETEIRNILEGVLRHQNRNSSESTYNERAKLSFHNHDVFRQNALE